MTSPEDIDAFKRHPLWDAVDDVKNELRRTRPLSDIDRATTARAKNVMQYLSAFGNVSPDLFPSQRLNQAAMFHNLVQALESQVQGWDQSGAMAPNTVTQIDALCDQILGELSRGFWPALPNPSRSVQVIDAARNYVETAESSLQALQADAELAHSEAQAALQASSAATQMAQSIAAEAQSTIDRFVSEQTVITDEWNATHSDTLRKIEIDAGKQREQVSSLAQSQRDELEARAEKSITSLAKDAELGQQLVQRVGDQARAGGYDKFARRERFAYRLWIAAGSLAVIATLAYLGLELREIARLNEAPDLTVTLLKTGLSVTAIAFSGFCFREAGKRQRNAIEANYRALDLLALEPFTEGMSETEATAFRRMLGERIFASSPEPQGRRSDEKVTTFRIDLADIKTVADTAKAVKDLSL
ncbi:hypothetical protein [Microbacterium sp. LWH13-1.2]|uniref:hypothetical protein n=1 Tax=Microbacterium sp. LWH13-1.2 TaxID=3135260 RepID=UPI0031388E22